MAIEISNTHAVAVSPKVTAPEAPRDEPRPVEPDSAAVKKQQGVQQVTSGRLEAKVSDLNDFVQNIDRSIQFSVSEYTGRTIIRVYNSETEELIREIPPEEVQRVSEILQNQLNEGLLFKTKV